MYTSDDSLAGRAYGRAPASYDRELAEVGPGTPGGELLRRYWQPFALSTELTPDLPKAVRLLGEDLIAFRDKSGSAGLVYPRCMHRGASLLYGKIEAEGIRCPYHGWLFDSEGHLLDAPCEIGPASGLKKTIRQPWYPVLEKYGLVFAYMGPPEKQPLFPDVPEAFEHLEEGETLVAVGGIEPLTGPESNFQGAMDFNWWSYFDNQMDPMHVGALHTTINGIQFFEHISGCPSPVKFKHLRDGSGVAWLGQWKDEKTGTISQEIRQVVIPNVKITGFVFLTGGPEIGWCVPVDDHNYRLFHLQRRSRRRAEGNSNMAKGMSSENWGPGNKPFEEWDLEDHQRWQTDYIVEKSQGPISLHSDEHLTTADTGTVMMRRLFKQQARLVMEGKDPVGSTPGEAQRMEILAGTVILDAETGEVLEGVPRALLADF